MERQWYWGDRWAWGVHVGPENLPRVPRPGNVGTGDRTFGGCLPRSVPEETILDELDAQSRVFVVEKVA